MLPVGKKVLHKHGPATGEKAIPVMPGLAPKPPPQTPSSIYPTVKGSDPAVDAPVADITNCSKCIALQSTLKLAFHKLHESQTRVQAALTLCTEAAERSNAKVDAYNALYRIYAAHGTPFQNGDRLPKEFRRYYPLHPQEDDIVEGLHEGNEDDSVDGRGHGDSTRRSSPLSEDSEESIPPGFQDLDSRSTDDESSNLSDVSSEADPSWELNPDDE